MPRSEIDDIFAQGKKLAAAPPVASSSSLPSQPSKKKKKGKRKRDEVDDDIPAKPVKKKVPETVFDPSISLSAAKPTRASKPVSLNPKTGMKQRVKRKDDDEGRFKDSRGTGPRKTTEEGFKIYKEDELGLVDGGGDTPLCPFDCTCCY